MVRAAERGADAGAGDPGEPQAGLVAVPGGPCVAGGGLLPDAGDGGRLSRVRPDGQGPGEKKRRAKSTTRRNQKLKQQELYWGAVPRRRETISRTGGFTLVELVVVIAIMAILAGIGTVAYTGYVQYTNKKLDSALKSEIAYAGDIGHYANPEASGTISVSQTGASIGEGAYRGTLEKWMADAFGDDWENTVRFRTNMSWVDVPFPYGYADPEKINLIATSNYGGNEASILTSVDSVVTAFKSFMESRTDENGNSITNSIEYAAGQLGMSKEEFMNKYKLDENATSEEIGNAMVLGVAEAASNSTMNDIWGDSEGSTALLYATQLAAITGYINSSAATDEEKEAYQYLINSGDPSAVLGLATTGTVGSATNEDINNKVALIINGKGLTEYAGSIYNESDGSLNTDSQAYKDAEAALAALSIINNYSGYFSGDLSKTGMWSESDTLTLLSKIMGSILNFV